MTRLLHPALAAALLLPACETTPPLAPGDTGGETAPARSFSLPGARSEARPAAPAVSLLPTDAAKLAALKEGVAAAVSDGFLSGGIDRGAAEASRAVLTAEPRPLGEVVGTYRCRTLKHGGPVPFVAYGYFGCEVRQAANGLAFEKTGGSQRMSGTLFAAPALGVDGRTGLAYAGVEHGPDEAPPAYPAGERTEVGLFERVGEDRYRLTIPRPGAEGLLDVIDLERS